MSTSRVIFRVEPERHEDIYGYLIRVATANHLGLHGIVKETLGVGQLSITWKELPALSYFCRLYPDEMLQCSGIGRRISPNSLAWHICGNWVTKDTFVANRRAKVCPQCLREVAYIRGLWSLNFYTACVRHRAMLIDQCPQCRKNLKWDRASIRHCSCGYDLAEATAIPPTPHGLMMAELIEYRCGLLKNLRPYLKLNHAEHERLAELSLDGLCKTVWFFGHCLAGLDTCHQGHGKTKPAIMEADTMIGRALEILYDWPHRFGKALLTTKDNRQVSQSAAFPEGLLGPVHHYLQDDLQEDEFSFVRAAYEQHIRCLWQSFRKNGHRISRYDRQLALDFDR